MAGYDQGRPYFEHQAAHDFRVWDGQTPVNGVPAQEVATRVAPGTWAYMLIQRSTNTVAVFQPHGLNRALLWSRTQASRAAQAHLHHLALIHAQHSTITHVLAHLPAPKPSRSLARTPLPSSSTVVDGKHASYGSR